MRTQKLMTAVLIGCAAATAAAQTPPPLPPGERDDGGGAADVIKEVAPPGPGPEKATVSLPGHGLREGGIYVDRVPGRRDETEYLVIDQPVNREKGAFLGVAAAPATPALREQLKLPRGMGLVVEFVEKGSPAEAAGLKQHDVITKLGDQRLVNAEQLAVLVRSHKPGDELELTILRGGQTTSLKAKLIEKELGPVEDVYFYLRGMPGPQPHVETLRMRLKEVPGAARPGFNSVPGKPGGPPVAGGGGGGGARPAGQPPRLEPGVSVSSTIVWTDGDHTLTITSVQSGSAGDTKNPAEAGAGQAPPERTLVAKDKDGTVVFEGAINDFGAREKMPPVVAEKLKRLEAASKPARPGGRPNP